MTSADNLHFMMKGMLYIAKGAFPPEDFERLAGDIIAFAAHLKRIARIRKGGESPRNKARASASSSSTVGSSSAVTPDRAHLVWVADRGVSV